MMELRTNVVVRYLTADDPRQARIVKRLVANQTVRLVPTVIMETEWVLRSLYGYTRERIHAALIAFAGLANVTLDDPPRVAWALQAFARGMDLADAIHLSNCDEGDTFATFDRRLKSAAAKAGATNIELLRM